MSVIEKMSIMGVRSFGPEDQNRQLIEFFKPLTLILGPNGSGKTTIIECLRYMTTGDAPPNSDRGGSFVHDPKVAGETEVKGQVKLQFRDVLGKRVIVTRSMLATQKQKKIQLKTLEGTITRYDANGDKTTLSSKCAEVDTEMISALGVSKAILNNVIFCHQEEANWPLSEGKALKQKFDDIFAATRYIKALDEIRKIRVEKMNDCKLYRVQSLTLKDQRRKADEFAQELEKTRSRLSACKDIVGTMEKKLKPITEQLTEFSVKEHEFSKVRADLDGNNKMLLKLDKDQNDLKKSIGNIFAGTIVELTEEMENFNASVSEKKRQLERAKMRCRDVEVKRNDLIKTRSKLSEQLGTLKAEAKRHKDRIASRDVILADLSQQLGLGELSLDLNEPLRDSQVENVLRNWKQRNNITQQELINAKTKYEAKENDVQSQIDKVRDTKSQKEQKHRSSIEQITKNKNTIRSINMELTQVDSMATRQDDLEEDLKETEEGLLSLEKSIDVNALRIKINQNQRYKKEKEIKLNGLNQEMNQLQKESKTRTEIDLTMKDKVTKQEAIDRLQQRHKETVIHLIGNMPKQNAQDSIKTLIVSLNQETQTLSKNLEKQKSQLSSLETTKKFHIAELKKKVDLLTSNKSRISDVCGSQNFDEGFDVLEKTVKELQNEKGALSGSLYLYDKYVEKLSSLKPCCPLCTREFREIEEAQALIQDLQGKLKLVPSQLEKKDKLITQHQKRLNSMLELRPVKDSIRQISETEIPELESKITKVTTDIENTISEISDLEEILDDKRCDLKTGTNLLPDLAMLDQNQRDLERLGRRLSTLTCQLGGGDVSRNIQQVSDEQAALQMELDSLKNEIETSQQRVTDHGEQVQRLRGRINDLKAEKVEIASSLQKKNSLEEQLTNLTAENTQLNETIKKVKEEVISLEKNIQGLMVEKKKVLKEKESELEKIRTKINKQEKELENIDYLSGEIARYINEGREEKLAVHENKIETVTSGIEQKVEEISKLNNEEKDLNKDISSRQLKYREYEDNMKLMENEKEIISLKAKCRKLEEKIGDFDVRTLLKEKNSLMEQKEQLTKERNKHEGRQTELETQIVKLNSQLEDKMFKDACKKHREMVIHLRTTELACEDLNKYYIALDQAVMNYHRMKMDEINKIIRDLWMKTYAGNDIDHVEIRSNADDSEIGLEKTRRVYNYKVVMVKGDNAIDMRGRCSAGQKVLASLIIRLALAETFCLNCGILALDEPTTNLDRDNISNLARALVDIVQSRSEQKNFQLIVITHDEDFIDLLGRSETVDYFYKVSKDANACSKLSKCVISEM